MADLAVAALSWRSRRCPFRSARTTSCRSRGRTGTIEPLSRCRWRRRCRRSGFAMTSSPSMRPLIAGTALRASTTALTKNDMKPSFTPCFFTKSSCIFLRSSMTAVMSHLVERRENRGGLLRVDEMRGDLAAQRRLASCGWCGLPLTPVPPASAAEPRRGRTWRRRLLLGAGASLGCGRGAGSVAGFDERRDVFLGDPPAFAGAGDRGCVELFAPRCIRRTAGDSSPACVASSPPPLSPLPLLPLLCRRASPSRRR